MGDRDGSVVRAPACQIEYAGCVFESCWVYILTFLYLSLDKACYHTFLICGQGREITVGPVGRNWLQFSYCRRLNQALITVGMFIYIYKGEKSSTFVNNCSLYHIQFRQIRLYSLERCRIVWSARHTSRHHNGIRHRCTAGWLQTVYQKYSLRHDDVNDDITAATLTSSDEGTQTVWSNPDLDY